jgi:hypothetical protein
MRKSTPREELAYIALQSLITSFEVQYLTGYLPYKFVKQDSNLFIEGRLVVACTIFSLMMVLLFHCVFFLVQRGGELHLACKS